MSIIGAEINMQEQFNYDLAFSRNIGWVTEYEQGLLRSKKIAVAGLGGGGKGEVTC